MTRTFNHFRILVGLLASMIIGAPALAHVGAAAVRQVRFPDQRPEAFWIVVLNVGLLVPNGEEFRWLCDEAITSKPGFNDLATLDADGVIWVAATRHGLFRTVDGGCSFAPVEGVLSEHQIRSFYPHPQRPGEALLVTETTTLDDDVHITTDAGETWTPAGLNLLWPIHSMVRSSADAERVYIVHPQAAMRSEDGGRSFVQMAHAPPGNDASPEDVRILATAPDNADVVYASIDRLPEPQFIRSDDGGQSWVQVGVLIDIAESLVISRTSGDMLVSMPFAGVSRSTDGGQTWSPIALLNERQSVSCMFLDRDGSVWACSLRDNHFVLRSDDFGDTWTSVFTRDFAQVTSTWVCDDDSMTTMACSTACDRAVDDCGEEPTEQDAGVPEPMMDSTIMDAGPPTDATVHTSMDSDPTNDAQVPSAQPRDDGGCQSTPAGSQPWFLILFGCLFGYLRRRPGTPCP